MRPKTLTALLLLILALFALLQPPSSTPARAADNYPEIATRALYTSNVYTTNLTAGAFSFTGGLTFTNGYKVFTNIIWPAILTLTNAETTVAITGAKTNDFVLVAAPAGLDQGLIPTARVTADGVVTVRLANFTAITITPITNTWRLGVLAVQ